MNTLDYWYRGVEERERQEERNAMKGLVKIFGAVKR